MISYCGSHITKEFGAPTPRCMAVQGMRINRFAGAGITIPFWPIGLHSILVANLLPPHLRAHGLLHDVGHEVSMSDIPKPLKTTEQRSLAQVLQERTYHSLGLVMPTEEEDELIHAADMAACNAEGAAGCGPRGYVETQTGFVLDQRAEFNLQMLLDNPMFRNRTTGDFQFHEMLLEDGHWPLHFERDLRMALREAHQRQPKYVDYRKAA